MRSLLTKTALSSLAVAGALLVAGCGHKDENATADTNMTNMDTMDSSTGMSNDMSAMDATANDANAGADMNAAGDAGGNTANAGNAM